MSGDIQARKRKGKGKKKDDFDDDVIETKTHHNNASYTKNHNTKGLSNGDAGGVGGGGSGMVAKAIFLLLLVSLSVVVALILVELRGKQKAAMEENISVSSKVGEEMVPPPPPPPPPAMTPPGKDGPAPPEASMQQEAEEEEPEPLGPTPPLEEYVHVVKEVVMEALPDEAPVQHEAEDVEMEGVSSEEEKLEDAPSVVDEVVEVVEVVTPVEEVVEIIPLQEEVVEAAPDTSEEADVDDVQSLPAEDAKTEELETEETGDSILKEEASEEPASAGLVEPLETPPPAQQTESEEEDKLQTEHIDESDDNADAVEEQPLMDEEDEEEEEDDDDDVESAIPPSKLASEEKVENEELVQEEEEEEDWSQFGKEGSTGALTDAYLKVEVLAEDILVLDPQNSMVAQLAPHMSRVLQAMDEGQTEGLLDTLNHIQVILEDVKKRIEDNEPIVTQGAPLQDEKPDSQQQPEPESVVEAETELSSEPETVVESQAEHPTGPEPISEGESVFQDDPETQTTVEPGHQAEPLSGLESEMVSEEELKPKSVPETETQTEKEADVEADTETQTEETVEIETKTQTEETVEIETESDVVTETQTQAETETDNIEETDNQRIGDVEAEMETGTKTESEEKYTNREIDDEAETGSQLGKETQMEEEGNIDTDDTENQQDETETVDEADTQTQTIEAEADIDSGAESVTQEQPLPVPVSAEEEHEAPQATRSISEADIADIEAQIIPDSAPEDTLPLDSSPAEDEEPVTPQVAEGGPEPVPVDEVIPDPIHIEPLQESDKEPQVEAVEEKQPLDVEEKDAVSGADDDSVVDSEIREELDQADKLLPENPERALHTFGALLHHNPKSARAIYGRARSLDKLAEIEKSNSKLEQAILTYRSVLDLADEESSLVPLPLLRSAAERCIERMKFRGFLGKALRVQQRLLQRFTEDVALRNNMGVTYLLMNQGSAAKEIFEAVLQQWPDDGFAQVHYGFVLKTTDNNVTGGAYYMQKGIESMAEGTQDERFYFHLGDALQRQGKVEEAYKIYDEAVEKGMFLNRYQRSLYNVDRLTSRPFWTLEQTTYQVFFRKLEENWEVIRNEGVALLGLPVQDGFRPEAENLKDIGDWKQYELFTKGRKITANCVKAPRTCSLIEEFPAAAGCKRGQVKFSVMQPHTHVHAHTGPTNCRLRAHLGLVVPKGVHLKVGLDTTTWEEGKILLFDDSWEHEVWHEGDSFRLVLIVDVWHPELTEHEHKTLSPI